MITGLGSSPGEGIGYPLHYAWASLVAQIRKSPPVMLETWVLSLGWEDPVEEGMVTGFAWGFPHGQRNQVGYSPWGCKELDTTERLSTAQRFLSFSFAVG